MKYSDNIAGKVQDNDQSSVEFKNKYKNKNFHQIMKDV